MTRMRFQKQDLPPHVEDIVRAVIGAALEVHSVLGPGLLETVYERALVHELSLAGLRAARQRDIVVDYKGLTIHGQRLDMLVEELVVVELKAVAELAPVHAAQLLSYLRAADLPVGLLFNFNTTHLRDGMKRIFNERALSRFASSSSPSSPSRSVE